MQKQSKILCKYCEKTLIHLIIKQSETNALHKHLILRKCREMQIKTFSAQNALNSYYKTVKTVRIYHIHLSYLLTFFRLRQSYLFTLFHHLISQYLMNFFSHSYLKQIFYFILLNIIIFEIFLSSVNQVFRFHIKSLSR